MPVEPAGLAQSLRQGLAPIYLLHGDEPLLIEEAADELRAAAIAAGYGDRAAFAVDAGAHTRDDIAPLDALEGDARAPSLFSSLRLLELRVFGTRVGEALAQTLTGFATAPPPDTVLLVIAGRLEKSARATACQSAVDKAGVRVFARAVRPEALPGWIAARLRARALSAERGVGELLIHFLEGNLLAIAQEIDKLALLCPDGRVTLEAARTSVADNARFDVYAWVDACVGGDGVRANRMLWAMRAEGTASALALWALAREVRTLVRMAAEIDSGAPAARVVRAHRVWSTREAMVRAALGRLRYADLLGLLQETARADRIMKGRAAGDIWLELERLGLALAGVPTPSARFAG